MWQELFAKASELALSRADEALSRHKYLEELAKRLREVKLEVLENLDYYVEEALKSVERVGGRAYLADDAEAAREIIGGIVGRGRVVVMGKSNTALEVRLRDHLEALGNEVWETDLGEFIIQLGRDSPSNMIAPALHLGRENVARLFKEKLGLDVGDDPASLASAAGEFLKQKFAKADVGITGANAVAADTGAVINVENEGNIRKATVLPPIYIAIAGIEKIVPTLLDAVEQALVQAAYHGLYPPTYIEVSAGPSSTADIELVRIRPAQGPREFHLVLLDNGRRRAAKDPVLREALLCIRCVRCNFVCPVYKAAGREFGEPPYVGPNGVMWLAVVKGVDAAGPHAAMCAHAGNCKEVCPMGINITEVIRYIKAKWVGGARRRN
ncbi:MAG: lactate utilization protein [Thermoproteus sp.]|nr:lactate utilization protein [Thermoproteus sp.]